MKLWKRFFGKRKKQEQQDWEQVVYVRDDVDFHDREQRRRYITECLEQIAEATRETELLTGEYRLVTSYLTDIDELEALPREEHEGLELVAKRLAILEKEKARYKDRENRMKDVYYYQMRKQEKEVEEGIRKLKETESYGALIKQDLQKLDSERQAYAYRRTELENGMGNMKGMAVIFLTALVICLLMLAVLQFGLHMDTYAGYIIAVGAAAVAVTVLCVKYTDADKELARVEKAIHKLIQLQNTVKIRYVNNTQLLDYLYMKYNTDSADRLEKLWHDYQQEKEERKQFAEAEAKTEYYQRELVTKISRYRVCDPERWIHQANAFLDKREMVEIRHELILRRQALRRQLDYNNEVAEAAQNEVLDISAQYPSYTAEIMEMMKQYGK